MRLLLDQGLPRSTIAYLQKAGVDATHVGDIGQATASDASILETGRRESRTVVTLDADFNALLVLSGAAGPSVIRVRMEGLGGEDLARLLTEILGHFEEDLTAGAMVSATENGIRIRRLPLLR